MRYGFPKGKPYFGETDLEGAIREVNEKNYQVTVLITETFFSIDFQGAEECGVEKELITQHIDYGSRIRRNVYMKSMNTSVEHYYYVVPVPNKEIDFKPQQGEIEVRFRLFPLSRKSLDFVLLGSFHIGCRMVAGQYAAMLLEVCSGPNRNIPSERLYGLVQ